MRACPAPRRSRSWNALCAAVLAAALAIPGAAGAARAAARPDADAPCLILPRVDAVRPGDEIRIGWSAGSNAIEELELLLSVDGGRHYALRISPELDPRVGAYVWRVPNLAAADARVRIRFHRDGREADGAPSESFRIAGERTSAAALVAENLWWANPRALDVPGARDALAPAAQSLGVHVSSRTPAIPSRAQDLAPGSARAAGFAAAERGAESPPVTASPAWTRSYPRRN